LHVVRHDVFHLGMANPAISDRTEKIF